MPIWEGVLINKNGGDEWQFFLIIGTAPSLQQGYTD